MPHKRLTDDDLDAIKERRLRALDQNEMAAAYVAAARLCDADAPRLVQEIEALTQERDATRRWARAWKRAAKHYRDAAFDAQRLHRDVAITLGVLREELAAAQREVARAREAARSRVEAS